MSNVALKLSNSIQPVRIALNRLVPWGLLRWLAGMREGWPILFFACCLLFAGWAATIGWNRSLLDSFGFRQTQTAMSAYYMLGKFPTLAYETPVFGPPWTIPFEFPLYQWIVAGLVTLLGTPLDQTARLVSLVFFSLTLVPANYILQSMAVAPRTRLLCLGLFVASPFYIFWSRTCMIESTSLFLSVSYLALAVKHLQSSQFRNAPICASVGALAAAVKITTFLPFFLIVGGVQLARLRNHYRSSQSLRWAVIECFTVVGGPILCAAIWTKFADSCKTENPLTVWLLSINLHKWNFGTNNQRFGWEIWKTFYSRAEQIFGSLQVLTFAFAGLLYSRRRVYEAVGCFLLYVVTFAIFINLHYVHLYYQYANAIFLIAAVGFTIVGMRESGGHHRRIANLFVLAILVSCIRFQVIQFNELQRTRNNYYVSICEQIQQRTDAGDVILVAGCDWSPELPYYAKRRALMLRGGFVSPLTQPAAHIERLRGYKIGALVVHRPGVVNSDPIVFKEFIEFAKLSKQPSYVIGNFDLYLPIDNDPRFQRDWYPMFSNEPLSVETGSGKVREEMCEGVRCLLVHAPGLVTYKVPIGARRIEGRFGILPAAYERSDPTDGVEFVVESVLPSGQRTVLWRRFLDPGKVASDRGIQTLQLDLSKISPESRLELRTGNPPGHDNRNDWSFWTELKID